MKNSKNWFIENPNNCRNLLIAKETRRDLEISAWQNLAQRIKNKNA